MLRFCFLLLLFISIQSTAQITGAWEGAGFERDSSGEYPVMSRLYIKNESGILKGSIYLLLNGRITENGEFGLQPASFSFDLKKNGRGYRYEHPHTVIVRDDGDDGRFATLAYTLTIDALPGDSTLSLRLSIAGTSVIQAYLLKDRNGNDVQQLLNKRFRTEEDSLTSAGVSGEERFDYEETRGKRLRTIAFENGSLLQLRYFPKDSIALAWVNDLNPIPLKLTVGEFSSVQKSGLRISSPWVIGHWRLSEDEHLMGLWLEYASISFEKRKIKYPTEKYYELAMALMEESMPDLVGKEWVFEVQANAASVDGKQLQMRIKMRPE